MSELNKEKYIMPPDNSIRVLDGQGWVGLLGYMGNETTITNSARVSFQNIKDTFDEKDERLLNYLIKNNHMTPFEHVCFSFSIHCPLFVRSQWMRSRTWAYNEVSRRYTSENIEFYIPSKFRKQSENNRQASTNDIVQDNAAMIDLYLKTADMCLDAYNKMINSGVCREQARGILPQTMMTTFWGTVNLRNLLHFIELRDDSHAQEEIRVYAHAMKELVRPIVPHVIQYFEGNKV